MAEETIEITRTVRVPVSDDEDAPTIRLQRGWVMRIVPDDHPTAPVSRSARVLGESFAQRVQDVLGGGVQALPGGEYLFAAKYNSIDQVRAASDEELLSLNGIGPKTLDDLREAL